MNIYIANLSFDFTDDDLKELFTNYGTINSAKVILDKETHKSKGFGFVEMPNDEEGQKAIDELNGATLDEKVIKVSVARPRSENNQQRPQGGYNNGGQRRFNNGGYRNNNGGFRNNNGGFRRRNNFNNGGYRNNNFNNGGDSEGGYNNGGYRNNGYNNGYRNNRYNNDGGYNNGGYNNNRYNNNNDNDFSNNDRYSNNNDRYNNDRFNDESKYTDGNE